MQAREAPGQVAEQALLPGALLDGRAGAAHVHRRVRGRVTAGVAQGVVGVGALRGDTGSSLRLHRGPDHTRPPATAASGWHRPDRNPGGLAPGQPTSLLRVGAWSSLD